GRRWSDLDGLRTKPRAQSRGPACSHPSGSVSGTAVTANVYTQAGWPAAPARDCRPRGQDRPAGDCCGAQCDLRGRLPRVLVWIPSRARHARRTGCARCRDREHEDPQRSLTRLHLLAKFGRANDPPREGHMTTHIGRRELPAALSSAAAAWPLGARAQQPAKVPRVGILSPAASETATTLAAF